MKKEGAAKDGTITVSFRLNPEQYARLEATAAERGCSIGDYARALALVGGPQATHADLAPQALDRATLEALIRKAAWAVIVALSPELDEEKTEAFLREYLP